MSLRIHELHPTFAHFPLALLPVAFLADLFGRLSGRRRLMDIGKFLMPAAAAAGLVAQEAVEPGDAHDILITHRNLNAGMLVAVGALALLRARRSEPGAGYLLATAGAIAGMAYTGYLGGMMVYRHGVGVLPARGVREQASPELHYGHLGETARLAADHAGHAAKDVVHHLREGNMAPALRSAR